MKKRKSPKEFTDEVRANQPTKPTATFEFEDSDTLVEAINTECQLIRYKNEVRYVFRDDKDVPDFFKRQSAKDLLAPYKFFWTVGEGEKAKSKQKPGFDKWLESPNRFEYQRAVFNPNLEAVAANELNLFTGYAVTPAEGDWSLMHAHIKDNICNGDDRICHYLLAYIAQMFQRPWEKVGVATVLRGEKGVGKSILLEWLLEIIGLRHGFKASQAQHVTGRFNKHLGINVFLIATEAFFAGDPQLKGPLKDLITGNTLGVEPKGVDITQDVNCTHLFIDSNERHVVPAESGERRFFVLDVGKKKIRDTEYFGAIVEQMKNGGAAAMLHDLLAYDYADLDLRNPPMTAALAEQIRLGFKAPMRWLESILIEGSLPFKQSSMREAIAWASPDEPIKDSQGDEWGAIIPKDDVVASYCDYVQIYKSEAMAQDVGKFLYSHIPGLVEVKNTHPVTRKRIRYLKFPMLADMRTAFLKANSGYTFPDDPVTEDDAALEVSSPSNVTPFHRRG